MKTSHLCIVLTLVVGAFSLFAANNSSGKAPSGGPSNHSFTNGATAYHVIDHGENHRVWQRQTIVRLPNGTKVPRLRKFTEVASGMYYQAEDGQWLESKEIIEAVPGGAVARQGQFKVSFANNLNSAGAIDLQAADGKRLRSNILGLMYFDSSTGDAVLIAKVHDATGELVGNNQILYSQAFDGLNADVQYTYKRGSFEQDIILREQPPTPESLGMNPNTTELQVMTEFLNPPQEMRHQHNGASNQTYDYDVSIGTTYIGRGRAFDLQGYDAGKPASVSKEFIDLNGRKILLEKVMVNDISAGVGHLPRHASIDPQTKPAKTALNRLLLPKPPLAKNDTGPMRIASKAIPLEGYVLDYVALNASETNFNFQADMTYFVSGAANLYGTTTIEGGTVIKFDPSSDSAINVLGTINCQTGPYTPAVFASQNDSTVGEAVGSGSGATCSGSFTLEIQNNFGASPEQVYVSDDFGNYPVNDGAIYDAPDTEDFTFTAIPGNHYYCQIFYTGSGDEYDLDFWPTLANGTIVFDEGGNLTYSETGDSICTPLSGPATALNLANGGVVHDIRVSNMGVGLNSGGNFTLRNAQFVNCTNAIETANASFYAGNVLMSQIGTAFYGSGFHGTNEQITIDQCGLLTDDSMGSSTTSTLNLANAILTVIGGNGVVPVSTNHVVKLASNSGIYQVCGAASHYLPTNSPYLHAGTPNIDVNTLAGLSLKTTCPPLVYSNTTIAGGTFPPYVPRDTNSAPNLGYHYDPLDYCFGGVHSPTNAVFTFTAGTAVGWFELSSGFGYGISLPDAASVNYNGTVTAPCVQARYSTVQEGGNGNWPDMGILGCMDAMGSASYNNSIAAIINARFTLFACFAWEPNVGQAATSDIIYNFNHCVINSGSISSYVDELCLTNCLLLGTVPGVQDSSSIGAALNLINCTEHEGRIISAHFGSATWPINIRNCAFEKVDFSQMTTDGQTINTNVAHCDYNAYVTNQDRLPLVGAHDVIVTNFNWQTSWFGTYYLPPNSPLINAGSITADQVGLYQFTTQTNQVKETNSIVDIGYHYVATDMYGYPIESLTNTIPDYIFDASGNGLPDSWELTYFGNLGQTVGSDFAGDGLCNLYKYLNGLNPTNLCRAQLAYWPFDDTNTWADVQGQLPLASQNITGVPSWNTNAVFINSNTNSKLRYPYLRPNGNDNITFKQGSVRFWFQPGWNSASAGGSGPGDYGRLVEMGNYHTPFTNGWWSLYFTPDGNRLVFGSSTNSAGGTNAAATVSLSSNQWYQIVVTYSPTNSVLYLNGQVLTNGLALTNYPAFADRTNGIAMGADQNGTNQAKGTLDEMDTLNYALNAWEVNSNYQAMIQKDKNGDGMADYWEWTNFGTLGVDPNADPDGDGISNIQEYQDGTNPHQFDPVRIGYWQFNDAPYWQDTNGLSPSLVNGLYPVPSWSGDAVKLNPILYSALGYPRIRDNGSKVLTFPTGSVRFWFKPGWSTYDGGQNYGPRDTVRLFEVGRQSDDASYGWMGLTINSEGNELMFATEANGFRITNAMCSFSFNSNSWNQIVLTYTNAGVALYVNGQCLATGTAGLTNLPALSVLNEGFHLGCSWDGIHQADGVFDELETFNYPLSALDVAANYVNRMSLDTDGDGLSDIAENGYGSRIDAWDSDCDGIPDGWEATHGANPTDPTDATPARMKTYMGDYIGALSPPTMFEARTITNVFEEGTFSFGNLPAGYYTVYYAYGAWSAFSTNDWCVDQIAGLVTNAPHSITVNYNDGSGPDSGDALFDGPTSDFSSQSAAETAWHGHSASFTHHGGDISLYFVDWPYDDNLAGTVLPTFYIYCKYSPVLKVVGISTNWLTATQCQVTFSIHNSSPVAWSGITANLSCQTEYTGITLSSMSVTGWSIAGGGDASLVFVLNSTPVIVSQLEATIKFSDGVNVFPDTTTVLALQARPGTAAVYEVWPPVSGVGTYTVYCATNTPTTWGSIGVTTNTFFQHTNLSIGTTYYYKVVAGGSTLYSGGAVPFGCADPLPPRIDYVTPLKLPATNGAYPLSYQLLLNNSDATDPGGYPMVFMVDRVVSGSLMVDGLPFSLQNNVINANTAVVWTPPAAMPGTNTPAFRVYVADQFNRSAKTVDVFIKQSLHLELIAWGNNRYGSLGNGLVRNNCVGDLGLDYWATAWPFDWTYIAVSNFLSIQQNIGLIQNDIRWGYYPPGSDTTTITTTPQIVMPLTEYSLDNIVSFSGFNFCSSAVTSDGKLWMWGSGPAYAFGIPKVTGTNASELGNTWTWGDPFETTTSISDNWDWEDIYNCWLTVPSPVQVTNSLGSVQCARISHALGMLPTILHDECHAGVGVTGDSHICVTLLLTNGTLWSLGDNRSGQLGRLPYETNDLFDPQEEVSASGDDDELGDDNSDYYYTKYGLTPHIVEIPGATTNDVTYQSKVLEFATGDESGVAICDNGKVWGWGNLPCWVREGEGGGQEADFVDKSRYFGYGQGPDWCRWQPLELNFVEDWASGQRIIQISVQGQHFVVLRADGAVAEFGYVSSMDTDCYDGWSDTYYTKPDIMTRYSLWSSAYNTNTDDPVDHCPTRDKDVIPVTGLPGDVIQISAAPAFGVALTSTGEVWGWGHLYLTDDGSTYGDTNIAPHQLIGFTNIVKVLARNSTIWAVAKDGSLWASGFDYKGYTVDGVGILGNGLINLGLPDRDYISISFAYPEVGRMYLHPMRIPWVENVQNVLDSEDNVFVVGTTIQDRPTGINALATIDSNSVVNVQLTWTSYSGAQSYRIYRSLNEDSGYVPVGVAVTNAFVDTDPSLMVGTAYYYKVSAYVYGVETPQSYDAGIYVYPLPDKVQALSADWTCRGLVKLQWSAPTNALANPPKRFVVKRDGLTLANLQPDVFSFVDESILPSPPISYNVYAVNISGSTPSDTVQPTNQLPCAPAPATNSLYVNSGDGQVDNIEVSWTGPDLDATPVTWNIQSSDFQGNDYGDAKAFASELEYSYTSGNSNLSAWLWSQFSTATQVIVTNSTSSADVAKATLLSALNQIISNSHDGTRGTIYTSGRFSGITLRSVTSQLFSGSTTLTGTDLVRYNRLLMDDFYAYVNGHDPAFVGGPSWNGTVTGFRIHYRTVTDAFGSKQQQEWYQDVGLSDVQISYGVGYPGLGILPATAYVYNGTIPAGRLCWISVSAIVDGEEGETAPESGPGAASAGSGSAWDTTPSLRATPGYKQVYLDWDDADSAASYDLYYSTDSDATNSANMGPNVLNTSLWQPVPGGTEIQLDHCWHTNLTVDTTYYYALVKNDYFTTYFKPQLAFATVTNAGPLSQTNFYADASPYDGMVSVEWIVPKTNLTDPTIINQTEWQFYVERKPASADDSAYTLIASSGYGLAYLDSDVVNGESYTYRVTAFNTRFDRLQALAQIKGGTSTQITPTATNGLTLLPPTPGNGYVDLAWSPIRATQFVVNHAMTPNGPFDIVATLEAPDAYENAQNTFRHVGLQNGVTNYYQIEATTPTGFLIDSDIKGVVPLATLPPLPPSPFTGRIASLSGTNMALLSWHQQTGAAKYQVFLKNDSGMTPLYDGIKTSYEFPIPEDDANPLAVFTFAARSVNSAGLPGELVEINVTNQSIDTVNADNAVVLSISGTVDTDGTTLAVVAPTNLLLSAITNIPDVEDIDHVDFYSDGNLIDTATQPPYQVMWYHVPAGDSVLTAVAITADQKAISSTGVPLHVTIAPMLSAYQTSATDLQIPAPALPITLSRSYSSRSATTNGVLGVGWQASWNMPSAKLTRDLTTGWTGVSQTGFASQEFCGIRDNVGHALMVTLPDGESIGFGPELHIGVDTDGQYITDVEGTGQISFDPYDVNGGTLSTSPISVDITSDDYVGTTVDEWNTTTVEFDSVSLSGIAYTSPDGTSYQFGNALSDGYTWLLTKITDRNGNSLNYIYDGNNNLTAITNSCGRKITLTYTPTTLGTNISVYDPNGGSYPVLVYVTCTNRLTEVRQLTDRSAGTYLVSHYAYGGDVTTDPADFNRLTDAYDARGIRMVHNIYTNTVDDVSVYNGDLAVQYLLGVTNAFFIDSNYNLMVTASSSTAVNTVMVNSDSSGAISGAALPAAGSSPSGTNAVQVTYDDRGRLIAQTDALGGVKSYTYDDQDRLVGQSDENGNSSTMELNDFGQPTTSTDANGKQTTYDYDDVGNPTSIADPSGTATSSDYSSPLANANGDVLLGAMLTVQRQNAPFVPYTITTMNGYDTADAIKGDLLAMTNGWLDIQNHWVGAPVIASYTYDNNGNRLTETKTRTVPGGTQAITTTYTYDAMNRVVQTVVSATGAETLASQTTTVTYNSLGKQWKSADAAGRVTTNIYDYAGNLVEVDYPDGTVSRTVYDGNGRQLCVQDRAVLAGDGSTTAPATTNRYDASGRVVASVRLVGMQLKPATATAGQDFTALSGYESQIKMTVLNGGTALSTNRTFYDILGRVQYSVSARGAVTENCYDAAGHRTNVLVHTTFYSPNNDAPPSLSDPVQSTSYTYDANGNQVTMTDAVGNTTVSVYDDANRVIQVQYPTAAGGTASRSTYYDGLGRKTQETDEAGVSTAYTYDFRSLLTSVTLAFGTTQAVTTVYTYDELGNQTMQTDALGRTTTNRYDALGRRTARYLPGGQKEGYAYDISGNLLYHTNFNGVIITNQYDFASSRLTNVCSAGYQTIYTYSPTGLRTGMLDAGGTNTYTYDSQNQLTNKLVQWCNGPQTALSYGYDALGTLTNLYSSTVNGVSNAYQYDILGRLTNVLAKGVGVAGYNYDKVGNLQSLSYGNGVTNLYQYDPRNRLTNLVWKAGSVTLGNFAYIVANTGNRIATTESLPALYGGSTRTHNWTYDDLYQLTGEAILNVGTVNYAFDQVGNRTTRSSGITEIGNQTSTYNANDWLTTDGYDANGNTASTGTTNYQYDVMNHLTNANSGAVIITYDGDGSLMSKKVGGTTTYYLVDNRNPSGYVQALEEWTSTGTPVLSKVYNYGHVLISERQISGAVSYYGTDGHGSVRFLTDTSGNVTDAYAYDAYGILYYKTGTTLNNYLYCGQQWDSDLGMYYLRARYYRPDTGRFWTMDSYEGNNEDPSSLHKYLYVQSNPINLVDLNGHDGDLVGLMMSTSIAASLDGMYNGGVLTVGNSLQATLFGVQAGKSEEEILVDYLGDVGKQVAFMIGVGVVASVLDRVVYGGSLSSEEALSQFGTHVGGEEDELSMTSFPREKPNYNDLGPEACVPSVSAQIKTQRTGEWTFASDVTGGKQVSSQRNAIPGIEAATAKIKEWAGVKLEQDLTSRNNWKAVSTKKDAEYVVFFGEGGKHVVTGRVSGGSKTLFDPGDLRRNVTLEEMINKWGKVSGIYTIL